MNDVIEKIPGSAISYIKAALTAIAAVRHAMLEANYSQAQVLGSVSFRKNL